MRGVRAFVLMGILLFCSIWTSHALEIVQPEEGQKFVAGATVRVVVKPQADEQWMGVSIGFESLQYNNTIGAYVREFPVPIDEELGTYEFKVDALSASKQIVELKRSINIILPPTVTLKKIEVNPNPAFLYKLPIGSDPNRVEIFETQDLSVSGIYSDGVQRLITLSSAGTTYASSDEKIVTVDANGKLFAKNVGVVSITIRNNGLKAIVRVIVKAKMR
jgi:hypothetical protein